MTTTPSRTEQVPASRTGALIAVLVGAAFVMILNETVLSVALRDLSVDLGVPTTTTQWLTSGFLLTMAVVIPTTGYLLDRFTPRQVFLASLGLFTVGTAVAGFAPGFAMLLVGRIVQAGGTAMMLPLLMTTILRLVPAERRGATMGTITIVIAVAPAIGPTIGGAILSGLGWRWMFWLVLPLAVLAMAAGGRWLRIDGGGRPVPLDVVSVLLSAVGFGGLVYGLSSLGGHGGGGLPPWVPVVVGLVALAVFVLRQLRLMRDGRALLDLRPFRRRQFVVALVLTALVLLSLIGVAAVLLPLYLQTVLGTSTLVSGLVVLPGGLLLGLLGRPVGALFDRVGARPLVIPGAVLMAAGLLLFSTLGPGTPLGVVVAFHLVLMGGLALMMTPLMTEALGSLPDELYSHGSAILSTLQQVAGALGTALFVTVAALGSAAAGASPDASGLHAAFAVAGGVGVLAVLLSLLVRRRAAAETPVG
ncbi:Drug resistance transporter EmrB/QacA subfamily [Pseudonocardia sp. Ae406_Ps2]|uniref:DHA2 family efflux MFS transporter permease subunit n=1 Tax=unclassified Pseudonocardia TaxID=2619320 RepID=UPI00094B0874|nr:MULTISPECIES: DHA2 family efflux MFS transporter permease subunit [unclassified Pseudonocardia]OLM02057.1 Drug resistance transporter EmrB/QacA subfamily [Pseudonocardia sp. Ae406_Ps2]OLM06159.1 Drug resistance transporter EmrB/QacA subfamily [Pseudonocardia sp. Ae331_Ps2]OLM15404.1 Drug resistance transporter EmrB/QacA subfamily [Pseudonocardia sp. Ae505_Ps2]OLM23632.1 Drug resistance transporter EmrB/QacA subfamily [Pseudonocardia sp. Ae706_Ps2]